MTSDSPRPAPPRNSIAVDAQLQQGQKKFQWLLRHCGAYTWRRSRVEEKLEKLSVADALRAIRFAEVVVVMMDAQGKFEEQDLRHQSILCIEP